MKQTSNRNFTIVITIFFWILLLLPMNTIAQDNNLFVSNASFAEKIYLQFDRKVYINGDTVWFKCIVSNASEHIPSILSGVLYVELIGADKKIILKKIVKIKNGIGYGNFDLDKKMQKGNYLIRAYTQWNQNFDDAFVFEEYIQIFPNEKQYTEPIGDIKLIKEPASSDHLEVFFNPEILDSLQKNKLNVYITVDGKKDSLLISKDKNNRYILDYDLKKESQLASLKIETENQKSYTKSFILNHDYLDLQFFPESGELVNGLSSKVGFKAVGANGKGKIIEGDIVDEKEKIITSFKSNTLGMGYFFINSVDISEKYYAKLKFSTLKYPLPSITTKGNTLAINKQGQNILVKVASNYMKNDSIYMQVSRRGIQLYEKKISLNQGVYQSLISIKEIPEGIIAFTILNEDKEPIVERLYFNEKPDSRLKINLVTDKEKYSKRALTNLNIQTTNDKGEPVKSNSSVLVINKSELGSMQKLRQNILSYFLVNSELKGTIENPGYYFKNNANSFNDLDALMLTQGWSKYNYSKSYPNLDINPEKTLTVSGKIADLVSEKKAKKGVVLTMVSSGKNKSIYNQPADSLGRFKFNLDDEYGKEIDLLFQTTNKSNKKINSPVILDQKKSPSISFEWHQYIEQIDNIIQPFIKKSTQQKEIDDKYNIQSGGIVLNEVSISAKMSPNKQKVTDRYGKPKTIISGKEILSKEKKWSYGLYSVLLFNYPDKVRIERDSTGILHAVVNNLQTLVVIDGIPVIFRDYMHIANIPPSEVSSFEIIEFASGFGQLYCEVHTEIPACIPPFDPSYGNVIAIYTRAGIGLFGAYKPKGLTQTSIPVFSESKEFYAPKYENLQVDDWKHPDIRALIYWQPILKTDDLGKAATSFYNTDNNGKMTIVVEAISDTGEIGYQELDYEVSD